MEEGREGGREKTEQEVEAMIGAERNKEQGSTVDEGGRGREAGRENKARSPSEDGARKKRRAEPKETKSWTQ